MGRSFFFGGFPYPRSHRRVPMSTYQGIWVGWGGSGAWPGSGRGLCSKAPPSRRRGLYLGAGGGGACKWKGAGLRIAHRAGTGGQKRERCRARWREGPAAITHHPAAPAPAQHRRRHLSASPRLPQPMGARRTAPPLRSCNGSHPHRTAPSIRQWEHTVPPRPFDPPMGARCAAPLPSQEGAAVPARPHEDTPRSF